MHCLISTCLYDKDNNDHPATLIRFTAISYQPARTEKWLWLRAHSFFFFFANTCFYFKSSGSCWKRKRDKAGGKKTCNEKEENLIPCPGSRLPETSLKNTVSSLGKGVFLSLSSFCCLTAHFISSSQDIFHVASLLKIHLHLHTQKKKKNTYDLQLIGCTIYSIVQWWALMGC